MIYKCKYCGEEFDNKCVLGGHTRCCKLNPNYKRNVNQINKARACIGHNNGKEFVHKDEICECQYCHKQYKLYGVKNHEKSCKYNPNKIQGYSHAGAGEDWLGQCKFVWVELTPETP